MLSGAPGWGPHIEAVARTAGDANGRRTGRVGLAIGCETTTGATGLCGSSRVEQQACLQASVFGGSKQDGDHLLFKGRSEQRGVVGRFGAEGVWGVVG